MSALRAEPRVIAARLFSHEGKPFADYRPELRDARAIRMRAVYDALRESPADFAEIEAERRDGKTIGPFETVEEFIADLEK